MSVQIRDTPRIGSLRPATDRSGEMVNRFQELVTRLMLERHISTKRELARRSGIHEQTIGELLSEKDSDRRKVLDPENVDKLARALGVDRRILSLAAAEWAGFDVTEVEVADPELQALYATATRADDVTKARVVRMLHAMLDDPDLLD